MKVRMERFVLVPFSIGCNSHSSVAVVKTHQFPDDKPSEKIVRAVTGTAAEKEESSSKENYVKRKKVFKLVCLKKLCDKTKFISTIKILSQVFVYKEEDEDEDLETEMEIGYPTDVKHVTHIGLDGTTTTTTRDDEHMKGWKSLKPPPDVISLPTITLRQFELAMAAQATNHH